MRTFKWSMHDTGLVTLVLDLYDHTKEAYLLMKKISLRKQIQILSEKDYFCFNYDHLIINNEIHFSFVCKSLVSLNDIFF